AERDDQRAKEGRGEVRQAVHVQAPLFGGRASEHVESERDGSPRAAGGTPCLGARPRAVPLRCAVATRPAVGPLCPSKRATAHRPKPAEEEEVAAGESK